MKSDLTERKSATEAVRFLWAAKFKLPPNDERLLRATTREALEHVHGVTALEQLATSKSSAGARTSANDDEGPRFLEDDHHPAAAASGRSHGTTSRDAAAKSVADTPHLTGDWAEWDALELSETDPSKPPLVIKGG